MILPFIVAGLVLGSLYALSGVGMLVLYRTTGVLNFGYGALGAMSAMLAWQFAELRMQPILAYVLGILAATALSLLFGFLAGPFLATVSTLTKATATLGLALVLLGIMLFVWNDKARFLRLITDTIGVQLGTRITLTQIICLAVAMVIVFGTTIYLRRSQTGTSMRALASDRELASMLGVRVRRIELLAWSVSGALAGFSGILLSSQTRLEPVFLTFIVIPFLAAVVVGRFGSLAGTLIGGLSIGVIQAVASAFPATSSFSNATPFVVATIVILFLQRRKVVTIEVAR
ncbi:branched-chain amino acid ABC transporter permease [Microbacterium terricola]|uniref:Branched-chain amino acid ABC transporter permease n=1 Tax=Microbacterium terricola TaxID=344163 RepID=A0ABM8E3B7_9MICO|nr:branched-chain amino acid ABC transporter permease [Microbacterium terricola]UYK40037.1 branched-chain amino acid ABC transporter permease [Microbacterium terricola]BDV32269.1 branched-chain amino acid ABC transporter permease [Microbacterium terricola]